MTTIYRDEVAPDGTVIREGIMAGSSRGTVRFFSPIMNVWGTIALVGGAIYSAWIFRRKNIMRNRVVGNWLIAAGGLLPALGGALIRLGDPSFQYLGTMLGAILIFIGFRMATNVPDDVPIAKQTATSGQAAGD
jgi:4-hydroxybenzoate polyprenyltransferase